jgi:hypothetical protein
MAHRKEPDDALTPVDGIDQSVAPDPELPEAFELAPEGLANPGFHADRPQRGLDPSLHLGRQVANDVRNVWRDVDPPD